MNSIEELKNKIPFVKNWINDLLRSHQSLSKSVFQYKFSNLETYYDNRVLSAAKVIVVDKVPMIPLSALGLEGLSDFENGDYAGITYLNTYFLSSKYAHQEALHFHELIHVVQWDYLGVDRFILLYGLLLLKFGYRSNPLEEIAYKYQGLFEQGRCPKDLVNRVCFETHGVSKNCEI